MQKASSLLVTITALSFIACGQPAPTQTADIVEPPPAEESTAVEPAAEEQPVAAPAPDPSGGLSVTRLSGTDSAPATSGREPTTANATVAGGAVMLTLSDFVTFCSPTPSFTVRMDGETVVVQAERPDNPTRCIGPHSANLRIDGVAPGQHTISVRNSANEEVATAEVTL